MTHLDKGKYHEKHPAGTTVDEGLKKEIEKAVRNNNIACKAAERIAQAMNVALAEVGVGIDLLNVNLVQCQLGLFGFAGDERKTEAAQIVAPDLEKAIRDALVDGRLPCAGAWKIADGRGMKRIDVCAACEALKIKIKPCQLGAF